jgi:hypothetical protein
VILFISLCYSDEEIDKEALLQLNEALLVPLLPKIGSRAKFLAKLNEMKQEVHQKSSTISKFSARNSYKQTLESLSLVCFQCEKQFSGWHALTIHLKVFHNLTTTSNFVCGQSGCQRDFQSLAGLRRHILCEHRNNCNDATQAEMSENSACKDKLSNKGSDVSTVFDDCSEIDPIITVNTDELFDDNDICLAAASFVAKLKSHSSIPSSAVNEILQDVQNFFSSECIRLLEKKTLAVLKIHSVDMSGSLVQSLLNDFANLGDLFNGLKTEYQQIKYFQTSGYFIEPETVVVGHRLESQTKHNVTTVVPVNATAQHVPLSKTFKSFFELPGILARAKSYMNKGHCETLYDFIDGSLWQNRQNVQSENQWIIPFMLYFDDFEKVNALGSRAGVHKLGAVYACLKSFSPRFNSQLKNLFLTLMFYSQDRAVFGNVSVFRPLVEEIKFLQNCGITIVVSGAQCVIKFQMVQILGDNLGLNSLLGYTESFSANHYCRMCRVHKQNVSQLFIEDQSLLRNVNNYIADVHVANVSETGVKHNAIWNEISGYHVTENWAFDIMHDLLEGVCNYDMRHIINYLVNSKKFLSIDTLNARIQGFDYGTDESSNKPPVISGSVNVEALNMKVIEMLHLVKNFGLMIGDLVPEQDEVWNFYLVLRQILDLVLVQSTHNGELLLLQALIAEHHELYVSLFDDLLKPKHHFMIHYVSAIKSVGPLRWLWSMRFESKHGQAKKSANIICNFKNICKSLSQKHQLKFCYRLFAKETLSDDDLVVGTGTVNSIDQCNEEVICKCLASAGTVGKLFNAKWITFNGTVYRADQILLIDVCDDMPVFAVLNSIFIDEVREVYLIVGELETVGFVQHVHAYEVSDTVVRYQCLKPQDLVDYRPLRRHHLPHSSELGSLITLHCAL